MKTATTATRLADKPVSAALARALTRIEEILGGGEALARRYGPGLVKSHTFEGLRLSYPDPADSRYVRDVFINPNPVARGTYDVRPFRSSAAPPRVPEMNARYIGVEPGELAEIVHGCDGVVVENPKPATPLAPTRGAVALARLADLEAARVAYEEAAAAARVALGVPAGCRLVDLTDQAWNCHTKVTWNGDAVLNHKKLAAGETFRAGDGHHQIRLNRPRVIIHHDEGLVAYGGPSEDGGPTDQWYVFSRARKNPAL